MKRLLFILCFSAALWAHAQTIQYLGSPTTQIYVRGQLRIDSIVYLPLRDTTFTPAQVGAMVVKSSNGGLYLWNGIKWNLVPIGSTTWGTITGSISSQTDLIALLNGKQATLTPGYGIKMVGSTILWDSANARKVDTVYRTNDSTITYAINGHTYSVLIRGTAAGGISSLSMTAPSILFTTPVTFSNTGGAWSGSLAFANQTAGTFLAGPISGPVAAPTMRAITTTDLPTGIPNGNLAHSSINVSIGTAGTTPAFAAPSVDLGGNLLLNLPWSSATVSGPLLNTDWIRFNTVAGLTASPPIFYDNVNAIISADTSTTSTGLATQGYVTRSLASYVTGANNGLIDSANIIQWGEHINEGGNPAKLLTNKEIPFNAHSLRFYDTLNTSVTKSSVRFWDTANATTSPLKLIQNKTAGYFSIHEPFNYGVPYTSAYRPGTGIMKAGRATSGYVSAVSLDAMPDNVYEIWGYNSSFNAARTDTSDAAIRIAMETNYLNSLDAVTLNFEYHDPEVTLFNGTIFRTDSKYISKTTGYCQELSSIDDHEYFSVKGFTGNPYAQFRAINDGDHGTLNLYGNVDGNPDGAITFTNYANGKSSTIQGVSGNIYMGAPANPISAQIFNNGNIRLAGSVSLNPTTWKGVVIGTDSIGTVNPVPSAVLQLIDVHKGFLTPVMTTIQRLAISSPAEGLEVYDTDLHLKCFYNGTTWLALPNYLSGSFSGVGAVTTTFTVTIGATQANSTYKINVSPTNALSAALFYITNKTTTTFDVIYLSGLTGTVAFDWSLFP